MRIKQLELIGFKSFAHRTVLDFPRGITAVVGPNGCGKSNVVDAIRWVLGEQSPKHLRGAAMDDVIFKGNERVAPTGMAQVSITFENDPHARRPSDLDLEVSTLPAHFRDLSEIMVTRRYFRSGESEYFINKTSCRLKDITELFLGTGIGSKAYAIIEQGRVEQLINAKPEDRRLFIEEAAGTTLYRSRKLAAERKMERTRENLLRVHDVLREIERQIQYLHRLAKKAEQYRALQDEVRQLDLALSAAQWRRLDAAIRDAEADAARERDAERQLLADVDEAESERQRRADAQAAADHELARGREAAAALDAECESLRQRIELLGQQKLERERRGSRLAADIDTLRIRRSEVDGAVDTLGQERNAVAERIRHDEGELTSREAELAEARANAIHAAEAVEAAKTATIALVTKEAESRNALAVYTRRRDDARRRLDRLAAEQDEASQRLAALEADTATRREAHTRLRDRLQNAAGEKDSCVARVRGLAEDRRQCEREAQDARDVQVQLRSRLQSQQDVHRSYEGYQRGVRSILLDAQPHEGVLGVVADVLGVPQEYERAVAAALGDQLQYVIVRDENDGVGAVQTLRHSDAGRGSFIPLSPRRVPPVGPGAASLNGSTRRLLDVIDVDEPYRQVAETLLSEVVVVPDLNTGLSLWQQNGVHVTMVTPEGDLIDATGVVSGGSERPLEEDIVSRRRVAAELEAQVRAADERLARAEVESARLQHELEQQEAVLRELDRDTHALTLELVAVEKDLERLEGERPRWTDRLDVARFEAGNAATEHEQSAIEVATLTHALAGLGDERIGLESELREQQQRAASVSLRVEQLGEALTAVKVRVAAERQRHEAATAGIAGLERERGELDARLRTSVTDLEQAQAERGELAAAVELAIATRTAREAARGETEQDIAAARRALEGATAAVAAHERRLRELRGRLDSTRDRCSHIELALAEKRVRVEHLAAMVREKYAQDLADVPHEVLADEDDALARLEMLREKVSRIGEVNVGAIEELRELEERAQFLRTQKEDLERSLADLERTIQRLNRASRTRFAETFAAVNERFQTVLPRLFRGGEAHLVLTDEHNLLETGVEIVVRPPGKRLDTVSLLSGGEKALVAVSLIFSLFLINPTPFCFLDEVDAPLDDANIGRFTSLVREMSDHSQFIVITHNKRTMQAADVLYGVTMEEPGISKVISVAMH